MTKIKEEDIIVNRYVSLTDEDKGDLIQIHINFYGNHKEAEELKQSILQNQNTVEKIKKRITELKAMHERKECDVLEGVDIGLLLVEELEAMLGE